MRNFQPLSFLSHPSNSRIFKQLQTLLRDGARPSLLFSITSELFLSPRGWYPVCRSFRAITAVGSCPPLFSVLPVSAWSVSRTIVRFVRSAPTTERSHQGFLAEKQLRMQNPEPVAIPIQCCISPFNARKHHSEKGLEPYRQLR